MFIDSHAHLFYEDFGNELPDVLRRAADAGIEKIIVPGTTLETSKAAVELAEKHPAVFACVGVHPHESSKASDKDLAEIESLSREQRVVGIGEIGLDYHYDFSPRARQMDVFKAQIQIAIRRSLPIVVHTRESMVDALETVREMNGNWRSEGTEPKRGVFHCFTGSAKEARELFDMGFFVSYPGIVTFKNSPVLQTLKSIGYARILLETDSPYLAPEPMRGKRNEPAHIVFTAKKIAEVLNVDLDELARVTSGNAISLFNLGRLRENSGGLA
ncbi:MAG: TatD family hydrolase [Ignavibacteriales bacterium]|nr:TatD family hydrolase [Ignavibacteriales bacterium]